MKIGIVIDELISGGFQKVAIMEAKYMQKMGLDVTLVVLHRIKNEGYRDLIKENGIKVVHLSDRLPLYLRLNFRFPFFSFFSFFHIAYPFFIYKYIKKSEFDIFITHATYTALSSIAIKNKLGIPYICFVHDSVTYILKQKYQNRFLGKFLNFLLPVAKKLDKKIIINAKSIIAFPYMLKELRKVEPSYQNYYPIYNGCEPIDKKDIQYKKENFAIAVTKWDKGKNFGFLLKIWEKMEQKIPLKVVGSFSPESLKDFYQKQIDKRGLSEYIEIVGRVSEEELKSYYIKAKFLIHPCREAFGMTILEAAACGCPAIFSINSGVAELFCENVRLILPKEKDLDQYLRAAISFLNNKKDFADIFYRAAIANSWEKHSRAICNNFEL